jgi:hypothetical protein
MAQVPTGSGCRNSRHTEPSSPRDHDPDHNYAPMTWDQLDAFGAKLPAAQDCMLMMWTPRPLVVMASSCWSSGAGIRCGGQTRQRGHDEQELLRHESERSSTLPL